MSKNDLFKYKYKLTLSETYMNPNKKPVEVVKVVERSNSLNNINNIKNELLWKLNNLVAAELGNPYHYVYKLKINHRTSIKEIIEIDLRERLIL